MSVVDDAMKEWKDMPEFVQEKQEPYRSLKINFRNEEDFKEFCKILGYDEDMKPAVKSHWYPKLFRGEHSNLRYVDTFSEN